MVKDLKDESKRKSIKFKSGYVGILGPTNAGKSSLLNALLGKKVSIVSPKVQTTLRVLRGILDRPQSQIIFVDTPGITDGKAQFKAMLNRSALRNALDCDVILWMFDVSKPNVLKSIERYRDIIKQVSRPETSLCVLNKIDKVSKPELLPLMKEIFELNLFSEIMPISVRQRDGLEFLVEWVEARLPEGPKYFEDSRSTDRNDDFVVAEMVREKVYQTTTAEIPYSVWTEVEGWSDTGKVPTVSVQIHVDSLSRKGILIGKGGLKLKEIGIRARKDIEKYLGKQVCLKLHVHQHKDWRRDERHLSQYLEVPS